MPLCSSKKTQCWKQESFTLWCWFHNALTCMPYWSLSKRAGTIHKRRWLSVYPLDLQFWENTCSRRLFGIAASCRRIRDATFFLGKKCSSFSPLSSLLFLECCICWWVAGNSLTPHIPLCYLGWRLCIRCALSLVLIIEAFFQSFHLILWSAFCWPIPAVPPQPLRDS